MSTDVDALARVRKVLRAAGASDDDIDDAAGRENLDLLAVDVLTVPSGRRYTSVEVSNETGLPLAVLKRMWRALGFLEPDDDDALLTELDLGAARDLRQLLDLGVTDPDTALQLARVLGSSMARVAEASLLRGADALGAADDDVAAADAFAAVAEQTLPAMARLLEFAWRRHMQAVARRAVLLRAAVRDAGSGPVVAVGFADMVGFTLLSQHLGGDELAVVVRRFEEISYDVVAAHGGRVVKTIGDEVMFVVSDSAAAARIGLDLAAAYADDDLLGDVRVGLAAGPVLVRDGDYFGATVNLAARIVQIAEPGTVLVSDDLHTMLEACAAGEFGGGPLRPRVLKDVGRVQLWSCRRRTDEKGDTTARAEARRARRERLGRVLRDLGELRAAGQRAVTGNRPGASARNDATTSA
ncbi:MAG TPA: adenylate cyclase regulatory domain-containing protein [Acidimicrobiales bacterium]|nr:adenylate cyclase regulatory domain-containing protein [Acidimicrobiales bacterium]